MLDTSALAAALPAGGATDWSSYAQTGGVVGVLTLLIVGILRQWIVPGWTYTAMEKDRDYYRNIANHSLVLADRQITVAEVLTERLTRTDREHREDRLKAHEDLMRRDEGRRPGA